ncbi:MAG TPA: bifunctional [glutamine synthetase] adenylyltransferase/[glutamine synthetase]-adenylyl-L-tyrosine phosphorylase [Acetobacteraceae bacterium]|nr:bifunctional [glutamine synthetase] adenylyltransferase/[glutamine synthetase]-adenylyl-L-tyrosine phosphorylase [Acetobacteraceae bacterium]
MDFAHSPYLASLAAREPDVLPRLTTDGPDALLTEALDTLRRTPPASPRAAVARAMRQAKRRVALLTALADIRGLWPLESVTAALSDLADATLGLAVAHLLRAAHGRGELVLARPEEPARESGFTVLGMGKLGARELNYSSDVDLVLLYDPEIPPDPEGLSGRVFSRMARDLVALMETRDADGYVFRTDLRLRPDPGATPPAIAFPGAIAYYESMALTWERAAMIKARPVAGDHALGDRFLEAIRPFIWRRHLDFAAIADIHAMKRRIDEHKGTALAAGADPAARVPGHNLKLGEGGIREVEFAAQALQLVWGGRDPGLRQRETVPALRALAAAGKLPAETATALEAAYRFLRTAEHRLQMVDDRQTHSLPARPPELAAFAAFMGYPDAAGFATVLIGHLTRVHAAYAGLFEIPAEPPDVAPEFDLSALDFAAPAEATETELARLGYQRPRSVLAAIETWMHGRPRALRSERARELLHALLPAFITTLARQTQPDAAFARLDAMIGRLPAGVQILSLLQRNPALLDRVAAVLGAAPSLADHLAMAPEALEGLIAPREIDPDPAATLALQLRDARMLEDALAIARRFVRGEEFRLATAEMEGLLDVDSASAARTALADATLGALLPRVLAEHAARYGTVPGGDMVVVALGKAGSREMMAGSDLDLMLVYDHPPGATESQGDKPVPVPQYYARAAQAVVTALTAPGRAGPLYPVDMRLRPSGRHGPVAVSLAAFRRYHRADAWTWERMALTRARVVAGGERLRARVRASIREALRQAGDPETVRHDAATMRVRMLRDLPGKGAFDVKPRPGGLMEVEFIAQVLQLVHARHRGVLNSNTEAAFRRLGAAGLLAPSDAALLTEADRQWRAVQSLLRITLGPAAPATVPGPVAERIARATGLPAEPAALEAGLDALALRVREAFTRLVGTVETG